jgi:type II secretion system protein N
VSPERLKKLQRFGAIGGFGFLVFLLSVYFSFPYDRIKDLAVAMAAQRNLDVEIGSAGPTFGFGISFADVRVRTRPLDGSKPTQVQIPQANISLSPLARLLGEDAVSVSADALGGDVDLDLRQSKTDGNVQLRAKDLDMKLMPGVKEAINLPLGGALEMALDLAQPNNRLSEAGGTLTWKCAACALGDGKEKLKVAGNPMLSEGMTLPRLRLGDFAGKVVFDKGLGRLQGVQAKSPDGEIYVEGEVRLSDPVNASYLNLYVRFKLSDALLKSNDKLQVVMQLVESMGKRPDGYYGFLLTGPLGSPGPIRWSKTSPFGAGGSRGGRGAMNEAPGPSYEPAAPRPPGSRFTGAPTAAPTNSGTEDPDLVDPAKTPNANLPKYVTGTE